MRRTAAGVVLGGLLAALVGTPSQAAPVALDRVVVSASSAQAAADAVERAGGTVVRRLDLVDAVAARLPRGAVLPGATVTSDEQVRPREAGVDSAGPGTWTNVYRQATHADDLSTGTRPVTVAVIDTGISPLPQVADRLLPVPDPQHEGQTAPCANFSSESTCDDSYGHGTFLAGLIAGTGTYPGMAPTANLVSVKIAGRNGSADTSALLAAIQYVVSFKDQLGIKVLNLSLGTDSTHDARKDPLNLAVERAWQAGITVVVAASNRGHDGTASTISKPADDPLVVTVGSVDDRGTVSTKDDALPAFTARGPVRQGTAADPLVVAKPDLVAPGVGLVSLVPAGSYIDSLPRTGSSAEVAGYRRGSGTSQSTAVVSGAAALLLQRRDWTPDEVKAALTRSTLRVDGTPDLVGAGLLDVSGALGTTVSGTVQPPVRRDDVDGLDATRGAVLAGSFACDAVRQMLDPAGCTYVHDAGSPVSLIARGTLDRFGRPELLPFDAAQFTGQSWYGQSWYSSQWLQGQSWYGQSWYGQSWYGQSWYEDGTPRPTDGASVTDFGRPLQGSAWYGVWR